MSAARVIIFIVLIPLFLGCTVRSRNERFFSVWAKGYMIGLGTTLVPGILCCILQTSLRIFILSWMTLIAVWILAAFAGRHPSRKDMICAGKELFRYSRPVLTEWIMILLVMLQVLIPAVMQHIDDDDATYVAMATTSVDTDTAFTYHPLTGSPLISVYDSGNVMEEDIRRYAVSPMFLFYAAESVLTGIRPAIFCHTVIPSFLLLAGYLFFYGIGTALFGAERREEASLFVIFASVWNIFSYISVYTAGTFMLIRIWQGKGQFAGVLVPALLAFWLLIQKQKMMQLREAFYLAALLCSAGMMTPMGGMLAMILCGLMILMILVRDRNGSVLFRSIPCFAIPLAVLAFYALKLS